MDANHCPGACIILFETKDTSILHTGDMRYHPSMKVYPALVDTKVDRIYLDTTYAHPKHVFLTQELAIEQVIEISSEFIVQEPNGVVLLCAYNLGKEKLITAVIDKVLNNAYIDDDKFKIFQCLTSFNDRISNHQFVTDKTLSRFHICKMGVAGSVMPYFKPNFESLELYHQELIASGMDASKILCIVPTGWAHSDFNLRNSRMEHNNSIVQLVPYSEHSNFNELKEFVRHFKPRQVIPTVYRDENDRVRILDIFQHETDATLNKQLFIEKLTRVTQTPGSKLKEGMHSIIHLKCRCNLILIAMQSPGNAVPARMFIERSTNLHSWLVNCVCHLDTTRIVVKWEGYHRTVLLTGSYHPHLLLCNLQRRGGGSVN
jgi:DNA ligase-1